MSRSLYEAEQVEAILTANRHLHARVKELEEALRELARAAKEMKGEPGERHDPKCPTCAAIKKADAILAKAREPV